MLVLKESADAFPPLKGVVSGATALCEIAERAKHSKSDARAIALRVKEIIEVIADAVPDGSISPLILLSIQGFAILLDEFRSSMEDIALTNRASRILHLNRNERLLQSIKTQLDDTYRDFLVASALRLEIQHMQLAIQQTQLAVQQTQAHLDLKNVASVNTRLLFYTRVTVISVVLTFCCPGYGVGQEKVKFG
ncbi:hypothetical protein MVEN_00265500 [Mycena venus]|uniref:Uncharacterized protein n=1 Tax=Mycena venus TaxID=2733690 RepID=A0A8H7DBI4_9AGAR|nr:hypothetical protein MVEN_00265500 [Mycena venus]